MENASAYQKERKVSKNLEEGVCETMNGLRNQGVFSLSTGEHGTFCANLNIVPKLENADELRLLSKADKHIARMQSAEQNNDGFSHSRHDGSASTASTASGYRAAFDYKALNSQLKEVGKLSLPTLSEIEAKIKNCNVSSLDLKNQFYSIELEPES